MKGISQNSGPASETYAAYAWDFLSRNKSYRADYLRHRPIGLTPALARQGGKIRAEIGSDKAAHKWGLITFANPNQSALEGFVMWRPSVFCASLKVVYSDPTLRSTAEKSFNLSKLECNRYHFVDAKNIRYSVLKSPKFWIQIYGKASDPLEEQLHFSVVFAGQTGARRRIDALRQLTSLSRDGAENFSLFGRQKARFRLRNALTAFDINAQGGTYRDISIALFGYETTLQNWDSNGGFMKNRAVRAYKLGARLVDKDYLTLLPKKSI